MAICQSLRQVQQAEQVADAADVHMSVGKLEMVSRAVTQMTFSAAEIELTSAEVWDLSQSSVSNVNRFANKATSYSIDPALFIDMTAKTMGNFGNLDERGPREIGANAGGIPTRSLDWKHAMHIHSRTVTSPQDERAN